MAIKLLLDVNPAGRQQVAGLLSEALILRQLQHPNIVRVEDVDFTEDEQPFVIMEYLEGESLRQRMQRGPLQWGQALVFAAQACAGLTAAHQRGIIHRDIKPQNVLLTKGPDGEQVKLIDFGIARVREEAGLNLEGRGITATGSFLGTPDYASPEQAIGMTGDKLDARSDVFSLGVVMYEMLTGVRPFTGNTVLASLLSRLQNDPISQAFCGPNSISLRTSRISSRKRWPGTNSLDTSLPTNYSAQSAAFWTLPKAARP